MPLRYCLDASRQIITITGDYAEPGEWRVLLDAIAADPDLARGYGFLRDLRASANPVSPESVVGIIAVVRQFWDALGARRAAIVTRPGIDLPAAVAHALAEDEHLPLRAFNSYEDALAWLAEAPR
jgi:hypothetical protein